ncbi:MAG: FAD-binding oxidoreductase [Chloroflexi bacterium]|nr:FAD-binding oxidoreductase [Chloroflexota bacterium]
MNGAGQPGRPHLGDRPNLFPETSKSTKIAGLGGGHAWITSRFRTFRASSRPICHHRRRLHRHLDRLSFQPALPGKRVVLLEAKSLGNGASGRNGGMILNWVNGVTDRSPEMTARIYQTTNAGIATIREIIDRHNLAVDARFDGALTIWHQNERAEAAHREVETHNAIGIPTMFIPASELSEQLRLNGPGAERANPAPARSTGRSWFAPAPRAA